jgi:hypothetical protein
MNGSTNGERIRYQVALSGVVAKVVEELRYEAFHAGKLQQFDAAWRIIMERLRSDPWGFGEFVRPFPHLKMKLHVGSAHPITVRFGIHEVQPLVVIAKVIFINPP